jgi:hypothetical protein
MDFVGFFLPQIGALLLLLLLAKMIAGKADEGREARTEGGRIEFTPNRRSFWAVYVFIASIAYVVLASLLQGLKSGVSLAVPAIGIGFVLFLLMAFPATIVVDDEGMEQVFWLRGRKRIAWRDVSKSTVIEKTGEVKITSKSGVKIVHTRQLPDRARLLAEVENHSRESVPVAPPVQVAELVVSGPAA